jgi:hypothetical protein
MTRPKLEICRDCGHTHVEHNMDAGPCGHTTVKDFRKALSDRRNLAFCKCKAFKGEFSGATSAAKDGEGNATSTSSTKS